MGFGTCRVPGCGNTTSVDYIVKANDGEFDYRLAVCGMWKHYAEGHGFLPTQRERETVMKLRPGNLGRTAPYKPPPISSYPGEGLLNIMESLENDPYNIGVMFVERTDGFEYSHGRGTPDDEWVRKLEELLVGAEIVTYRSARNVQSMH